jgi:hypothetical protein
VLHGTSLTSNGIPSAEAHTNVPVLLLPGMPERCLFTLRETMNRETYQKGKYIAFFSASVYYSLEFQQLPSVQDAQIESY